MYFYVFDFTTLCRLLDKQSTKQDVLMFETLRFYQSSPREFVIETLKAVLNDKVDNFVESIM